MLVDPVKHYFYIWLIHVGKLAMNPRTISVEPLGGIRNLMEGNTGKPYIRAHSQNGCCWDHNSLDGCIAPGGMLKNEKG